MALVAPIQRRFLRSTNARSAYSPRLNSMSRYERETVGLLKIGPCPFSPYVGVGHAEPHPSDVCALEHKIHQRFRGLPAHEAARLTSRPT